MSSRTKKDLARRQEKARKAAERSKKRRRQMLPSTRGAVARARQTKPSDRPCCRLCGATTNLIKTECCNQWICDDEGEYKLFSYARNSCHRNHRRFTLCGYHFVEQHPGRWQDCPACRDSIEPEMYAYYGTNEYNFEVLKDPPAYKPTHCAACGKVIVMADGGYSYGSEGYLCESCTAAKFPILLG